MSRRIYCSRCNRHFNAELVQVSNDGGGQWAMPNFCPECQDGHIGERPSAELEVVDLIHSMPQRVLGVNGKS